MIGKLVSNQFDRYSGQTCVQNKYQFTPYSFIFLPTPTTTLRFISFYGHPLSNFLISAWRTYYYLASFKQQKLGDKRIYLLRSIYNILAVSNFTKKKEIKLHYKTWLTTTYYSPDISSDPSLPSVAIGG